MVHILVYRRKVMNLQNEIGTGAQAEVYLLENQAVKVFKHNYDRTEVFYEAMVTSAIEKTNLPIAKVHQVINVEDRMAIVMEYIKGASLQDHIQRDFENLQKYISDMVYLQMEIHSKRAKLPINLKDKLRNRITNSDSLSTLEKEKLVSRLNNLPEGDTLCHGDYHGYNIIEQDGQYFIIDWIDAANGNPDGDVCRTYMLYSFYDDKLAEIYLNTYCGIAEKSRNDILLWLPVVAAARLEDENFNEKEKIYKWLNAML